MLLESQAAVVDSDAVLASFCGLVSTRQMSCAGDVPSLYAINLDVNPPDSRYSQDDPQRSFLDQRADG